MTFPSGGRVAHPAARPRTSFYTSVNPEPYASEPQRLCIKDVLNPEHPIHRYENSYAVVSLPRLAMLPDACIAMATEVLRLGFLDFQGLGFWVEGFGLIVLKKGLNT